MKKIYAVMIGAGQRGKDVYGKIALDFKDNFSFTAVVEPNSDLRNQFAKDHNIETKHCFNNYDEFFKQPKLADVVFVCTQDRMHYVPVKKSMEKGYDVVCEKPMSQDPFECIKMGKAAKKYNRELIICHVLRYSPFFQKIKELIDEKTIGEIVHIMMIENVAYWHQSHSFVRGNWRNSKETSPMILAKSCHDMDILQYLMNCKCKKISSFGNLYYFKNGKAPQGSSERCSDCEIKKECPYNAYKIYLDSDDWYTPVISKVVCQDDDKQKLINAIDYGPYGRCVFHCDNDVVDHQNVNLEFEKGQTASFMMCAFTKGGGRSINIMGTEGQITGEMEKNEIIIKKFIKQKDEIIKLDTSMEGHNGSDYAFMKNIIENFSNDRKNFLSDSKKSVMGHLMAFAAEESRITGKTINFDNYLTEYSKKSSL